MVNCLRLVKLMVRNTLSFKAIKESLREKKKSTRNLIYVAIVFAYLIIVGSIVSIVALLGYISAQNGLINEFIVVIYLIASAIVLIFGVVLLITTLFFSKDSEFLLSLPVKPSAVFLAKIMYIYVYELIISALIMFPSLIALGISAKLSIVYYIMMIFGIVLAPALPLVISAVLAIPLSYVVRFLRNRRTLASIIGMLTFGGAMGLYFYVVFANTSSGSEIDTDKMLELLSGKLVTISNIFYPLLAFARVSTLTSAYGLSTGLSVLVDLLVFFGSIFVLLLITVIMSSLAYAKGSAMNLETTRRKGAKVKTEFEKNSQLKALILREWKELIRAPYFAFQCLSGAIMTPILVSILLFSQDLMSVFSDGGLVSEDVVKNIIWFIFFSLAIMFGSGMNFAASSAITREGKNFYFSKMMPVAYKTQLKAKLILSVVITIVSMYPSILILAVGVGSAINTILALIVVPLYSIGFNSFAIYIDLTKPKLDWSTPQEAMKRNFRIVIPFMVDSGVSTVFIILPIICFLLLPIVAAYIISWALLFIVATLFTVIFLTVLFSNADKLYSKVLI